MAVYKEINVFTKSLPAQNAANIISTIIAGLRLVHTQVHLLTSQT